MKNAEMKVVKFSAEDVIATSGWVSINNTANNIVGDLTVTGSLGSAEGSEAAIALYGSWTLYRPIEGDNISADGVFESDTFDEDNSAIVSIGEWDGTYVWDPTGNGGSGWYVKQ